MTEPRQQTQQAVQQDVGAGIAPGAQVHDAWASVQNFFGPWARGTYGLFSNLAAVSRGQRR